MKIRVIRRWKKDAYTIGDLYINGTWFCNTLEDTDRGLVKTMTPAQIAKVKIAGSTAIPAGTYAVTLAMRSAKFGARKAYAFCGGYLPRLCGVPGYEGVLIHIGNDDMDTEGCILVGLNKVKGKVVESTATFRKLYDMIRKADERGENIDIIIES